MVARVDPRPRFVSRLLPFGAVVVWEALTDPVLVQGWLAPEVTPVVDAGASLDLVGIPMPGADVGRIRSIEPGSSAELDLGRAGSVRIEVTALEPMPTGRSQCMLVAVATPAHELADRGLLEALEARVAALHELLRGRPVDWAAGSTADGAGARA